jgi:hypothetical protein
MKMKIKALIISLLISLNLSAADYYLSPTGNDGTGTGTLASPWFTLDKAWTVVAAGDAVYMRGGTYTYVDTQVLSGKNGTAGNLIKVWAYQNEKPKIVKATSFTYDGFMAGLHLTGNYIHFKGIEMAGFTQQTNTVYHTFLARNCSYCIFEELNCHHGAFGFYLMENGGGTATGNLVYNCDFHNNADPLTVAPQPYGNADGMAIGYVVNKTSVNTVRGCRFYNNSDDGLDLWANEGYVIIDSCWSFHNGYREDQVTHGGDGNGFKLGDVQTSEDRIRKKVTNCIAFDNYDMGFTQNSWSGTRMNSCQLLNNVAYRNGKETGKGPGFQFGSAKIGTTVNIFKNNISYANWNNDNISKETVDVSVKNSWDGGITITDADFLSLDTTGVSGARVNGRKPDVDFLKLAPGSDCINAGTEVGIFFYGTKPDVGAYELYIPGVFAKTIKR